MVSRRHADAPRAVAEAAHGGHQLEGQTAARASRAAYNPRIFPVKLRGLEALTPTLPVWDFQRRTADDIRRCQRGLDAVAECERPERGVIEPVRVQAGVI